MPGANLQDESVIVNGLESELNDQLLPFPGPDAPVFTVLLPQLFDHFYAIIFSVIYIVNIVYA